MLFDLDVIEKDGELLFQQNEPDGTTLFFDLIEVHWIAGLLAQITLTHDDISIDNAIYATTRGGHDMSGKFNVRCAAPEYLKLSNDTQLQAKDLKKGEHLEIYSDADNYRHESEWGEGIKGKHRKYSEAENHNSPTSFLTQQYKTTTTQRIMAKYKNKEEQNKAWATAEKKPLPEILRFSTLD